MNKLTRDLNIPMYLTGMHGLFGYIITDLIEHESIVTKPKGNVSRQSGFNYHPIKLLLMLPLIVVVVVAPPPPQPMTMRVVVLGKMN